MPGFAPVGPHVLKMTPDLALQLFAKLFSTALVVCAPILGITMLVGLVISVLQVITQVQEASLTFVPKLLTAGLVVLIFGSWMLRKLAQFAVELWGGIPSMF